MLRFREGEANFFAEWLSLHLHTVEGLQYLIGQAHHLEAFNSHKLYVFIPVTFRMQEQYRSRNLQNP